MRILASGSGSTPEGLLPRRESLLARRERACLPQAGSAEYRTLSKKSPLRLPGLSLDFARDGSRDGELAEPKAWTCPGLTLHFDKLSVLSRSIHSQP